MPSETRGQVSTAVSHGRRKAVYRPVNCPSGSKYRNVRTNGFASKHEHDTFCKLKALENGGQIRDLRTQVSFPIEIGGELVCRYVADFVYREPHGDVVVADAKGARTALYLLKRKLMRACHGITIREL